MAPLFPRLVVAFDACAVAGALTGWPLRRVERLARAALEPGALEPQAFEGNLARPDEVRAALRRVRSELGGGARARLVLPDGTARMALLDVPSGADARGFARARLAAGLPYPASEAIVDGLALPGRRLLAAAIRRRVVEGYETLAAEAGLRVERVELAPLAALAALSRRRGAGGSVALVLGDVACSIAAFDAQGTLRAFRWRRRDPDPDEAARLRADVERSADAAGLDAPRLHVVGAGAPALISAFSVAGRPAQPGWEAARGTLSVEVSELAWLGAALT